MNPWKIISNSFFHLTYSITHKQIKLGWFWKGRVYYGIFNLSFHTVDLLDDGQFSSERDRYSKLGLSGLAEKSKQRPHHTGIHYNFDEKQLASLPTSERQRELDRREAIARTSGVRPHVG